MTLIPEDLGARLERRFTVAGRSPYVELEWERRDARIVDFRTGVAAFEQLGVHVPTGWSQNATNIVAQKYFREVGGVRESSVRQIVDRVADTITEWGRRDGYFLDHEEAEAFNAELKHLLVSQKAAFNSPVWFNIGVPGVRQQAAACFILDVEDDMGAILNWYAEEGIIFKGGSGAGVNLSRIRSSRERLAAGGSPSGPVSFMRGADASAGTIKSGGTTRRAAKMVVLNVDHPDVLDFIWCKAKEERKAHALRAAGFDVDLDGADSHSLQYQNANNSVRVTDEFLAAVEAGADWSFRSVTTGEVIERLPARDVFRQIAEAAWECADPGLQYDTTINRWNTTPNSGRIDASNPCSEHLRLANSACNLASLNLMGFLDEGGRFDVDGYEHATRVIVTAQDILVGASDYPTEKIAASARAARDIGVGYTNLGASLMALGLPYDSDEGRAWAAAVTGLLTGAAAVRSTELACRLGAAPLFHDNREPWIEVYRMHRDEALAVSSVVTQPDLNDRLVAVWDRALDEVARVGARNAELSVAAPTGTISFLLDADTTGVEPDLSLVKTKKLVGGGTMRIVNQTVPRALRRLGYSVPAAERIIAHVEQHGTVLGAPDLDVVHLPVFACAIGDNVISWSGHLKMMGAIQPFLSGAISKTVNVPEHTTIDEIEELHLEAWRLGIKAVAIYRDNCKVGQPLSAGDGPGGHTAAGAPAEVIERIVERVVHRPIREKLPRSRRSRTFEFRVADCKGFATVGEYDDGRPGELFIRVSKQGSTLAGIMDAFAIAVSHGLQYGVPLRAFAEAFVGMRFEPAGMTDDTEVRIAQSLIDYLFRRLAIEYLPYEERAQFGVFSVSERLQPTLPGVEEAAVQTVQGHDITPDPPSAAPVVVAAPLAEPGRVVDRNAPLCMQCGVQMLRAGSCYVCEECGSTSGCS